MGSTIIAPLVAQRSSNVEDETLRDGYWPFFRLLQYAVACFILLITMKGTFYQFYQLHSVN